MNKLLKSDFTHEKYTKMRENLKDGEIIKDFGDHFAIVELPQPTPEEQLQSLRNRRTHECFDIVNRGMVWYKTLEEHQLHELSAWYKAWLDVTHTKQIPQKPTWLNSKEEGQ